MEVYRGLPYGWESRYTEDGKLYFANTLTQTTSWLPPSDSLPTGWQCKLDENGNLFFLSTINKITTRKDPRWILIKDSEKKVIIKIRIKLKSNYEYQLSYYSSTTVAEAMQKIIQDLNLTQEYYVLTIKYKPESQIQQTDIRKRANTKEKNVSQSSVETAMTGLANIRAKKVILSPHRRVESYLSAANKSSSFSFCLEMLYFPPMKLLYQISTNNNMEFMFEELYSRFVENYYRFFSVTDVFQLCCVKIRIELLKEQLWDLPRMPFISKMLQDKKLPVHFFGKANLLKNLMTVYNDSPVLSMSEVDAIVYFITELKKNLDYTVFAFDLVVISSLKAFLGTFFLTEKGMFQLINEKHVRIFGYKEIHKILVKQKNKAVFVEILFGENDSIALSAGGEVINQFVMVLNGYHNFKVKNDAQLIQEAYEHRTLAISSNLKTMQEQQKKIKKTGSQKSIHDTTATRNSSSSASCTDRMERLERKSHSNRSSTDHQNDGGTFSQKLSSIFGNVHAQK